MPNSALPQSRLQLHLELTPSPNDPKDAPQFYRALGVAVVALARLENHFLGCVINILGLPETAHLARRFPLALADRLKIWNKAFEISMALNPVKIVSLAFAEQLAFLAEDRKNIVHGHWGPFRTTPPTRVQVSVLY
jgi:hypothetical protein